LKSILYRWIRREGKNKLLTKPKTSRDADVIDCRSGMLYYQATAILLTLLFSCFINNSYGQAVPAITGTVRNAAGEPLTNATVTVVKTNKGTITNAKGIFKLNNLNFNDKLRISLIGYNAQTVTIENKSDLTITLKEADNELDRVVVQAYGTTSDRLRTGNISKVTAA